MARSKAFEPGDTAHALRTLRVPVGRTGVRVGGAAEAVLATAALVTGLPALVALVALSYLVFAGVVVVALRSGRPISSCGCFGKIDTPPSWVHIGIDLASAAVAAAAAFATASEIALPDVLADQPLVGVPFLLLVGVGVGLVFLSLTALPKTLAAMRTLAR